MRDAIQHALYFTEELDYARFVADDRTIFATVRALEIVGERIHRTASITERPAGAVPLRSPAANSETPNP